MHFIESYLKGAGELTAKLDKVEIEKLITLLVETRQSHGRLFILGVGGGAGNATHAVNDFRKICGIETYTPTDNVSELTALINDVGWTTVFREWLKTSKLKKGDMILVFSVGGGNKEKNLSTNIIEALQMAKFVGAKIGGVVGPNGGYTAEVADACVKVPMQNPDLITPYTESFQALIWHLLVSDPRMKATENKWESVLGK